MREFTFNIDYEAGADSTMAPFVDRPLLVVRGKYTAM
jgi:hypothetical protein